MDAWRREAEERERLERERLEAEERERLERERLESIKKEGEETIRNLSNPQEYMELLKVAEKFYKQAEQAGQRFSENEEQIYL